MRSQTRRYRRSLWTDAWWVSTAQTSFGGLGLSIASHSNSLQSSFRLRNYGVNPSLTDETMLFVLPPMPCRISTATIETRKRRTAYSVRLAPDFVFSFLSNFCDLLFIPSLTNSLSTNCRNYTTFLKNCQQIRLNFLDAVHGGDTDEQVIKYWCTTSCYHS